MGSNILRFREAQAHAYTHTHTHTHRCADTASNTGHFQAHTRRTHTFAHLDFKGHPMGHPDHLCLTPQGSPSDSHGDPPPEASPSQTSVTPLYTLQMVFFKPQNHSFGSIGLEKLETYEEIKSDRYAEIHPQKSGPADTHVPGKSVTLSASRPFKNSKSHSLPHIQICRFRFIQLQSVGNPHGHVHTHL